MLTNGLTAQRSLEDPEYQMSDKRAPTGGVFLAVEREPPGLVSALSSPHHYFDKPPAGNRADEENSPIIR